MTTAPPAALARRPAARWFFLPLAVWLVSLAVLAVGGLGLYRSLAPEVSVVDPGDRIRVTGSGLALWQDLGGDRGTAPTCSLTRGGQAVDVEPARSVTLNAGGFELSQVGTAPGDLPQGTWTLGCDTEDAALYATREPATGTSVLTVGGSVLLFLGAVVLTAVLVARRRRSAPRTPPSQAWAPGIRS